MTQRQYPQLIQPSPRPPPGEPVSTGGAKLPGTLQAGLRQLFGSAATGLESASLSICIDVTKVDRVGADCQDKARSSSMCCSRSIVVSLTFVKTTRAVMGAWRVQGSRQRPAEPASGGADFVGAQGTGAETKLGAPLVLEAGMPTWHPQQTFPLPSHPNPRTGSIPVFGSLIR
jgi:hypothetical protein